MSINPYLDRLRGQIHEKQHPQQSSKPSKPGFEGFEGDQWCHVSGNERLISPENATLPYTQNLQNYSSSVPAEPDGDGCRVTIVELPAEGLRFRRTFAHLQLKPPALVDVARWRLAVADGKHFLAKWGEQAEGLGWSSADLFGLAPVPTNPHPSYRRLSRYDMTGLCWLLQGKEVIALTEATATIRNPSSGTITTYRRYNKPTYGPLGDSLEDFK
jgi:hypothetical protein